MQEAINKLREFYEAMKKEEWVDRQGQRMFLTGIRVALHELEKEVQE